MLRRTAGILSAVAILLSMGGASAAAAMSLPDEKERWIKVKTAHFLLFSNASEDYTLEIGTSLERFREALTRIFSRLDVNAPIPTFIYVFKHDASFRPYKMIAGAGPANVSGAFAGHRDGNYVAIDATPPTDPWRVIFHEYVHYFLNNNFTDIPLWFNEGTAECLSTFRAQGGGVEIGRPISEHVHHLKTGQWIQLPTLLSIDADSKDYKQGTRQATFYSESWALVHYLAWGRSDAQAGGIQFFARFPPRTGLKDALEPILGKDRNDLQTRVLEYVRRGKLTFSILDMKEIEVEPPGAAVPMSYAETLTRLGDYLLHSQEGRTADAQAHFQAAILADPSHAPAYAGMAYLRDLQKRPEDAAGYYEKALALDPENALTLFLYAESLMQRVTPPGTIARVSPVGPASPETARARELYKRSLRLRPDIAEAYVGLGATYSFADEDLSGGIAALEKARGLLPSRLDVVLNLAGLYARSGEEARARGLVERVLARSGDREMISAGNEILLQIDLRKAQALINRGEVEAGVSIIEAALAKTSDAMVRKHLEEQLAGIAKARSQNRQIETYNRAVALANSGNYEKAAAILEQLAAEVQDPGLANDTRTLLKRVRQAISSGARR